MNIQQLQFFQETAHRLNFAAVAARHDIDPSSVSKAIRQLERDLGCQLLNRTTRQMSLTADGHKFLDRCTRILSEMQAAQDEVGQTKTLSGLVRISASVAFGEEMLVPLLPEIRSVLPDVSLELLLDDAPLDLHRENIDLAIRLGSQVSGQFKQVKLRSTTYKVCCSPRFLADRPALTHPEQIETVECLLYNMSGFRTHWRYRQAGEVRSVPLTGSVSTSSPLALRRAAEMGMGVALLADWLADGAIKNGRLVHLFPDYEFTATQFDTAAWLIYPDGDYLAASTRAVIDLLRRRLRNP